MPSKQVTAVRTCRCCSAQQNQMPVWHAHKFRRRPFCWPQASLQPRGSVRWSLVRRGPARLCPAAAEAAEDDHKPYSDQMKAVEEQPKLDSGTDDVISAEDAREDQSSTVKKPPRWQDVFGSGLGRISYEYFNWRRGTWNDLQSILLLNLAIVLAGGIIKTSFVDILAGTADSAPQSRIWQNLYQVVVVVFGQEFPDEAAGAVIQIFSLAIGAVGLAAFALVIALTEQLVLEVLERNVRQGSNVYETGHILVLGWVDNRSDEEVMWKILSQVCLAYRNDGGTTVVVLSHRPKLSMEQQFQSIIPPSQRFGTRFVFRQGSPGLPSDLRKVAASAAAATIIVSDSTRSVEEADAQSLRAAVLLDELDFPGFGQPDSRTGHIIVELKQDGTDDLLKYVCSRRVIPLMTSRMNAVRCARLVRHPVVGSIGQMLWSFNSASQGYMQPAPWFEGRPYGPIFKFFPDAIVLGVCNPVTGQCDVNPAASRIIEKGDHLVLMRPTNVSQRAYGPSRKAVVVSPGNGWNPANYLRDSSDRSNLSAAPATMNEMEDMVEGLSPFAQSKSVGGTDAGKKQPLRSNAARQCAQLYMLPLEYIMNAPNEPERVLICGFGSFTFMVELIRALDHELPRGSDLTLFSERTTRDTIGRLQEEAAVQNISLVQTRGNPARRRDLRRLDITRYRCAIILCDQTWLDPDLDVSDGIDERSQGAMLRLDALVMRVQLNIRFLLEEANCPDINIIAEKVAFEGVTRFEDRNRLPLGTTVNFTAYSARMLTQAAYNPLVLLPLSQFGKTTELLVQDSSALAGLDEELSFWQLQARSATIGQVLMGHVTLPSSVDQPLDLIVNPQGDEVRSRKQIWNRGDQRTKLISLAPIALSEPQKAEKEARTAEGAVVAPIATTTNKVAAPRTVSA